jgi:hypothetical protein
LRCAWFSARRALLWIERKPLALGIHRFATMTRFFPRAAQSDACAERGLQETYSHPAPSITVHAGVLQAELQLKSRRPAHGCSAYDAEANLPLSSKPPRS